MVLLEDFSNRNASQGSLLVIGQPDCIVAKAQRIASRTDPLPEDFVGLCIDGSQGFVKQGGPDETSAPINVAAMAGRGKRDCGRHFSALRIDAGHGSVALIQGPDGSVPGSQKSGFRADWNRSQHAPGRRVNATPATGYAFTSWTGNVANPVSAATTTTMIEPEEVTANFTPLPTTVTAALASKSGTSNDRVWNFSFTNAGPGQANNIQINSFALTQTAGAPCSPVVVSTLPLTVGSVAPKKVIDGKVSIDFTGCTSTVRFSLAMGSSENGGASSSVLNLTALAE